MPQYTITTTPIVLPHPPKLLLPDVPSLTIRLPGIPQLPQLPDLPDLPEIPSLPSITLPDLPPPPTIPKLFGAISITLNILKLIKKILCIMRSNPFVPEWRAGDAIAQITERSGKIPGLDFLNVQFPQFNASFVDAIKVTTFVNLEFQVDFILELAKSAFAPINSFTSDFSNISTVNPLGDIDLHHTLPTNTTIDVGAKKVTSLRSEDIIGGFGLTLAYALKSAFTEAARQANESLSLADFQTSLKHDLLAANTDGDPHLEAIKENMAR